MSETKPSNVSSTAQWRKRWAIEYARGQRRVIPAGPTLEQVKHLRSKGWTLRGIAEAANVAAQTLSKVATGQQTQVNRTTAAKVLALRADSIYNRANRAGFVPRIGSVRRIRALMVMGWRHQDLDREIGIRVANILHQPGDLVSRNKHEKVCAAYDRLWDIPGPGSERAREHYRKRGFLPPAAWDDDSIDDPDHQPVLTRPSGGRRLANADMLELEVRFLLTTGADKEETAERMGTTWESLERKLYRHNHGDLVAAFTNAA